MVNKVNKRKLTYAKAKRLNPRLRAYADTDRDGVVNKRDCRPFDPKKQGRLHDLSIRRLKAREQSLENERMKVMKRVEKTRETLKLKSSIGNKKLTITQAKLRQKQALINEIKRERGKIAELKRFNMKAKKEIFRSTNLGKATQFSKSSLRKTRNFLNDPRTKRKIQAFRKRFNDMY